MLQEEQSDANSYKLQKIKISSQSLLNLVNDVLDFFKIEASELSLEELSFNLKTLAEETLAIFEERAEEKTIDLRPNLELDGQENF